jgi:hypothetical protein
MIQRIQRNAIVACVAMAVLSAAIARNAWYAVAVLGGGLLIGISFVSIARGVDTIAAERRAGFVLFKVAGRYALLGFLAYVMIARLRLPPLGLIAGASSVAVAAAFESVSFLRKKH